MNKPVMTRVRYIEQGMQEALKEPNLTKVEKSCIEAITSSELRAYAREHKDKLTNYDKIVLARYHIFV